MRRTSSCPCLNGRWGNMGSQEAARLAKGPERQARHPHALRHVRRKHGGPHGLCARDGRGALPRADHVRAGAAGNGRIKKERIFSEMTRKLPKFKRIKDMTPDEKKVLSQRIQLYGGVALIFILCALFLRFYNTRLIESSGILPTPRQIVEPIAVTYRAQDDPAWGAGGPGRHGLHHGARRAACSAASPWRWKTCGVGRGPGRAQPGLCGQRHVRQRQRRGPDAPERALPCRSSSPRLRDFDGEDITQALVDGRACMVRVPEGRERARLCVVGSTSEDFLVLDPAAGDGEAPQPGGLWQRLCPGAL